MTDDSEREQLRQSGELILAYQYTLQPGQTELRAQYDPDQPELVIALDPKLTPLENAQRYFDRYNRAKRALEDVPGLIEETRRELDYLAQLRTDLELATNWPEIDEVQQILQTKGYWRGKPRANGLRGRRNPITQCHLTLVRCLIGACTTRGHFDVKPRVGSNDLNGRHKGPVSVMSALAPIADIRCSSTFSGRCSATAVGGGNSYLSGGCPFARRGSGSASHRSNT